MRQTMITTKDNPFNYFTDFDNWYAFDEQKGYHSLSYLARIAKTSSDLTDKEYSEIIEAAVDEIVEMNIDDESVVCVFENNKNIERNIIDCL